MNVRKIVLDVDKAIARPSLLDLAKAIDSVRGVEALNIMVTEIDIETVGMDVTVLGDDIDCDGLVSAIEKTGAVVHSTDELVVGNAIVEHRPRQR
jgi:hypothetical protein